MAGFLENSHTLNFHRLFSAFALDVALALALALVLALALTLALALALYIFVTMSRPTLGNHFQ